MVIIKDKYWKSTPSNFYEKTSYVNFENNRIYNFKKIETIYNFHFRSLTVDRYYFQNKYDCIYFENLQDFYTSYLKFLKINEKFKSKNIRHKISKILTKIYMVLPLKTFINAFFSMKNDLENLSMYSMHYNDIISYYKHETFSNNIIFNNNYCFLINKILGFGSYGLVLDVLDIYSNKKINYAVKVFNNELSFDKHTNNEIKILKKIKTIKNKNLINYFFVSTYDKYKIIVLEKIEYSLFNLIQKIKKIKKLDYISKTKQNKIYKYIIKEIANGIKGLHDNKIIHCDLKPENILISSLSINDLLYNKTKIKIIDFGHSVNDDSSKYFNVQTRFYRSPEVILLNEYSYKIDIWSFGCIIYELIVHKPLFIVDNEIELIDNIIKNINIIPKKMINKFFNNIKKYSKKLKEKYLIKKFKLIQNYIKYNFDLLNNKNLKKKKNFLERINNLYFRNLINKMLIVNPINRVDINNILNIINN